MPANQSLYGTLTAIFVLYCLNVLIETVVSLSQKIVPVEKMTNAVPDNSAMDMEHVMTLVYVLIKTVLRATLKYANVTMIIYPLLIVKEIHA